MASIKRGAMIASILVLVALIASACERPFSAAPSVTNTPIDQSLFAPTLGIPTTMTDLQNLATGTALALQSGTPNAAVVTATPIVGTAQVDASGATVTPTSIISLPTNAVITPTATLAVVSTSQNQVSNTSVPVGSRPATYTLQDGEFPYCIARRFDVDPDQLLSLNGLVDGQTLYAGAVLKIPQSGSFPGTRALRNHPTTYTASSGDTIPGIACLFGDIDPSSIASANGLSVGTALTSGQQLSIP
jgi:LysM repeat protein